MKSLLANAKGEWNKWGQMAAVGLAFVIPISTALTSYLMILILLCWLFGKDQHEKRAYCFHHPLMVWIWPVVIVTLIGTLYSIGDFTAVRRAAADGLRLACIPILMFYYRHPSLAKKALAAFCAAMIATLVLGFLKVYAGLPIGTKFTVGAVFKSHIKTSFFMAMAIFFLAYQIRNKSRYAVVFSIFILLMIYYLLFMSIGRIGYITLGIVGLYFAWHIYRLKGVLVAFLIMGSAFAGAYCFSPVFADRLNMLKHDLELYYQGGHLIESSLGSRLHFTLSSVDLMANRPWIGSGTGSFGEVYKRAHHDQNAIDTDNPHNEYLRMGVELGLVGLVCLLLMLVQQWRLSAKIPEPFRGVTRGFLLAFLVGCFLNSWLKDFTEGYFYCVMIAIGFSAFPFLSRPSAVKSVSLIVTTYNWPLALDRVLESLSQQKYASLEVIIADDGSTDETAQLIEKWRSRFPFPLIHCWQPDHGFRAGMIRNRAVALAKNEYLIFIDGDCIVPATFVARHVALAEEGWFVAGNRVLLNKSLTEQVLKQKLVPQCWTFLRWFWVRMSQGCNRLLPLLMLPLAASWRKRDPLRWQGAKTCNLAMWKEDFIHVNGFDESFEGWGFEDSDCVIRLQRAKIYHKSGKFAVPVFHLWHPSAQNEQVTENAKRLEVTQQSSMIRVPQGVEQYL